MVATHVRYRGKDHRTDARKEREFKENQTSVEQKIYKRIWTLGSILIYILAV